jgi:hypothetical protein
MVQAGGISAVVWYMCYQPVPWQLATAAAAGALSLLLYD